MQEADNERLGRKVRAAAAERSHSKISRSVSDRAVKYADLLISVNIAYVVRLMTALRAIGQTSSQQMPDEVCVGRKI